jgi:hypothetical protein
LISFSGEDLVVVRAEDEAGALPRREVIAGGDGARGAVLLADGPELLEGLGALDRRLVGACGLEEVVDAAVGSNRAELGSTSRRVVRAEALNDVVLNQGVLSPAVDSEIAVAVGTVIRSVSDVAEWKG